MAPSKKPAVKGGDKSRDKGKSSTGKDENAGGSKLKAATAINTRHILVLLIPSFPNSARQEELIDYPVRETL